MNNKIENKVENKLTLFRTSLFANPHRPSPSSSVVAAAITFFVAAGNKEERRKRIRVKAYESRIEISKTRNPLSSTRPKSETARTRHSHTNPARIRIRISKTRNPLSPQQQQQKHDPNPTRSVSRAYPNLIRTR